MNPRHVQGSNYLLKRHDLLHESKGVYSITDEGIDFIKYELGQTTKAVDEWEGIFKILKLLELRENTKSAVLLPDWRDYLLAKTKYKSERAMYGLLRFRLANLISRGLVSRKSHRYKLTQKGRKYLDSQKEGQEVTQEVENEALSLTLELRLNELVERQREALKVRLSKMNPYAFEQLIGRLLEEMGYEDVEVTQASNDKGVDVIGTIENGISSVKEIVQVKRFQSNISNSAVNELRGVIPLFEAYRGTIITTSDFTKAAIDTAKDIRGIPVTLINGEKLIDLLIKYKIGIIPRKLEFFEVDGEFFEQNSEPA